jgi:hypothetical protein
MPFAAFCGTTEQLGEKRRKAGELRERCVAGAKARVDYGAVAARLKPCPYYKAIRNRRLNEFFTKL